MYTSQNPRTDQRRAARAESAVIYFRAFVGKLCFLGAINRVRTQEHHLSRPFSVSLSEVPIRRPPLQKLRTDKCCEIQSECPLEILCHQSCRMCAVRQFLRISAASAPATWLMYQFFTIVVLPTREVASTRQLLRLAKLDRLLWCNAAYT